MNELDLAKIEMMIIRVVLGDGAWLPLSLSWCRSDGGACVVFVCGHREHKLNEVEAAGG